MIEEQKYTVIMLVHVNFALGGLNMLNGACNIADILRNSWKTSSRVALRLWYKKYQNTEYYF